MHDRQCIVIRNLVLTLHMLFIMYLDQTFRYIHNLLGTPSRVSTSANKAIFIILPRCSHLEASRIAGFDGLG